MRTTIRSVFTGLTVTLMSGLAACGGDDNPTGPGKIGSNDASTASALAYGVVAPLVRDVLLESYIDQFTNPLPAASTLACNPLTICQSGSAEYCTDTGMLQVNFTDCVVSHAKINGSVTLTIQQGNGSGTFDLTVGGDFHMVGSVSYMDDGTCFSESFSEVTLTAQDLTIDMSGFIQWCDPRSMVGQVTVPTYLDFNFAIASLDRHVNVYVGSTEPGFIQVLIQNLNRNENLLLCEGNITGSSLNCFNPN